MFAIWLLVAGMAANAINPSGTLPVLYINTENKLAVSSKEEYLSAVYWLDPMGHDVEALGSADAPLPLQIRGRGNYTWTLAKKPYRIKLESKANLLGMNKSRHFVLMAHADDDHGFLREPTAFRLSEMLGLEWTPAQVPVELVMNGIYRGLYFAVENVRVAKDKVNVFDQEEEAEKLGASTDITGGWLVEVDNYVQDNQVRFTETNGNPIQITYHSPEVITEEQKKWLRSQMLTINTAAYRSDPNSHSLSQILDIDALARFYVHAEIMENGEAFHGSWYLYRDRGADQKWKCGPVWDMGQTLFHEWTWVYLDTPWGCTWMHEMIKNKELMTRVKEVFTEFVEGDNMEALFKYVDTFAANIEQAAACDGERWPQYNHSDTRYQAGWVTRHIYNRIKWLTERWEVDFDDSKPGMPSPYYVRSTMTNWWAVDQWQMNNGDKPGTYEIRDFVLKDYGMFKIADSDWSEKRNWGVSATTRIEPDQPLEVICGYDSKNISYKPGRYDLLRLTVNADGRHGTVELITNDSGVSNVAVQPEMPELIGRRLLGTAPFDVYTLQGITIGQRVLEIDLTPGFYIVNGHKILVK